MKRIQNLICCSWGGCFVVLPMNDRDHSRSPRPGVWRSSIQATPERHQARPEFSMSNEPGHTSRQACLISLLSWGWLRWNSTGLAAKHTITAQTELSMMLNSTVDSTIPIMKPILKRKCGKRSSSEKRVDRRDWTHKKAVIIG